MTRATTFRLAAACVANCVFACAAASHAQTLKPDPGRAAAAYLAGTRALERQDLVVAQARFNDAVTLDPAHAAYERALTLTRDRRITNFIEDAAKARLTGKPAEADTLLAQARTLDPTNELVLEHTDAYAEPVTPTITAKALENAFAPPIHIQPDPGPKDLHLRGDLRGDVTEAARTFGVRVTFDDSVQGQPYRFDLDHTTYDQALPILLRATGLFSVPLDNRSILVAKDTQDNRDRLVRLLEETIYVPGSTPEQLNELTNVVKNVFDIKQAVVSPTLGALILRAPEPTLQAVNATLKDLLDGDAQVVLELKLITLDKTHTLNTGLTTPTSFGAFSVAAEAQTVVSANQSILQQAISSGALTLPTGTTAAQNLLIEAVFLLESGLATDANFTGLLGFVGGGLTTLGVSAVGSTTFNFGLNTSEARALDDLTVRIGDRQTTTLKIGEKYPITTSTYSSGLTSAQTSALAGVTVGGQSAASLLAAASTQTIPIIQYEDLGITLKTQPTVLKSGLISLHIDLKIEALTGALLDNIPVLTSRNFVSDITVADGSPAMVVSLLSRTESSTISGIPGLSEIPGLAQSADDTLREHDSSELVLLATPHVVHRRSNVIAGPRIAFQSTVPAEY